MLVLNFQLLEVIFSKMNIINLKSARLVCQTWNKEASKQFPYPINIIMTPFDTIETLQEIAQLIKKHYFPIKLNLSLFDINWMAGLFQRKRHTNYEYDAR